MFEVLVFVYENYWRGDACPELHQLERKLSAHGFEADEIHDALVWLDGLNLAAQSTNLPAVPELQGLLAPGGDSMRVFSVAEQDQLGAECLGFVSFLESAGVLPATLREIVIDRAMAVPCGPMSLDALKIIVLMVYWHFGHEPDALVLDEGSEWFQPSNLEVTDLAVGNPATNVIPAQARARLSIRFNDRHTGQSLVDRVSAIAARHGGTAEAVISGESFITLPGAFSTLIAQAVEAETGVTPELSTTGGTSDARFLRALCPVVEFGLCNATMHKKDEAVAIEDLHVLARIYRRIALAALAG